MKITPEEALQKLIQGNLRFIEDHMMHSENRKERRLMVFKEQNPFAVIVSCSDSRVPPEILFDQSLGDLFVVRVAGNVIGPIELESIAFGAIYLKTPLIFVLGHESCGAVTAVLNQQTKDITNIAELLKSSVSGNPTLKQAVMNNVQKGLNTIRNFPDLAELIGQKRLHIQGGYYNLDSGKVDLINSI